MVVTSEAQKLYTTRGGSVSPSSSTRDIPCVKEFLHSLRSRCRAWSRSASAPDWSLVSDTRRASERRIMNSFCAPRRSLMTTAIV